MFGTDVKVVVAISAGRGVEYSHEEATLKPDVGAGSCVSGALKRSPARE
jgi:hypothetical protein